MNNNEYFSIKKRGKIKHYYLSQLSYSLKKVRDVLRTLYPEKIKEINKTHFNVIFGLFMLKRRNIPITIIGKPKKYIIPLTDIKIINDSKNWVPNWIQNGILKLKPVLDPFWNNNCKMLSNNLWIPDTSVNWKPKKYNKSFKEETILTTVNDSIEYFEPSLFEEFDYLDYYEPSLFEKIKEEIIRCRKVRFYPNKTQKNIIKGWIGTSRYVYNTALNAVKNGKEAQKVISQLEPKIVIPMHYALPKLKYKLNSVDEFLHTMGAKKIEPQEKLMIKEKDLAAEREETEIVVLQP